jgi:tetratricopeptide (TPR) repeat protein
MGVVYHARHEALNREVALKVMNEDVSARPEFRARFGREAEAAASLDHPNVVAVYHAGEEGQRLYLTMRYVVGLDLGRFLAVQQRMDATLATAIVAQVAGALDAAHAKGIVHRDVKPSNVLLEWTSENPCAYLTDFGLTKTLGDHTDITWTGETLGTVDYAAPEQLEGRDVDGRADVYALGCLLYHALTGQVPFPRPTGAATIVAHVTAPVPSVRGLAPELPLALGRVVERALAKDPDARYASAGELARAAQAATGARGGGVAVGPPPRAGPSGHMALAFPRSLAIECDDRPFVGRAQSLQRLRDRYRRHGPERPQFVLVCGEPGIGKTRLATEFARQVHAEGATVLHGRSDPEPVVPYQPFLTALQEVVAHGLADDMPHELGELSRFLPGLGRRNPVLERRAGDAPESRYRLFEAVSRVLARVARDRPAVLILDDLHWADASTALMLRHVLQHPEPAGAFILGTLRDVQQTRSDDLVDLVARIGSQHQRFAELALAGLDGEEVAEFVAADQGREAGGPFLSRIRSATAGNPLFLGETLRGLAELGPEAGGLTEQALHRVGVPKQVKAMIVQRLQRLAPVTRDVLARAAVIGTEFPVDVLEAIDPRAEPDVLTPLEDAAAAALVRPSDAEGEGYAFTHALVRDALCGQQSESRRRRLHHRIGEAMEARPRVPAASPAEIAHHFFAGRSVDGGAKALQYCLLAGDRSAASLAHEEAAQHYGRALTALDLHRPDDGRRRCEILLALGRVELRHGAPGVRETFLRAAGLARETGSAEQLAHAAVGFSGRYPEAGVIDRAGIVLLEDALRALPQADSALRVEVLARLAVCLHFARQEERADAMSAEALAMARRVGDAHALVSALESRHDALLHVADLEERLRVGDELLAAAAERGERELEALGRHWRVYDLLEAGDAAAAREQHHRLTALAEELRQPLYRYFAAGWQVVWAQMEGRMDDAERLADEALALGRRAQARDAETVHDAQVIALRRREDRLPEFLETIESSIRRNPALVAWHAVLPLAHLAAGHRDEAVREFDRLAADGFGGVPRDMFWFAAVCVLAETCAIMRDTERASTLYGLLLPHRDRNVQVTQAACWGSAERFLGLLAAAMGRWDAADEHLRSAIVKNARGGCPAAAALVRRDRAQLLIARGRRQDLDEADGLLHEALRAAEAAGTTHVAQHLRAEIETIERRMAAGAGAAPPAP